MARNGKVVTMAQNNDDFNPPVVQEKAKFPSVWADLNASLQDSYEDLLSEAEQVKRLARADVDLLRQRRIKMELDHKAKLAKLDQEVGS